MSRSNDIANITSSVLDGVTKAEVGLGNVDNTADSAKPVSTAQQSAIDGLAYQSVPHIIPDVLYPAVGGNDIHGTDIDTSHGSTYTYGTAHTDGRKYYYTDIKGSKPIKDPRIGGHFGSQRHRISSLQILEQETATHGKDVFSIDGRDWLRVVGGTITGNDPRGSHIIFKNGSSAPDGDFLEITGYFNKLNYLAFNEASRMGLNYQVNGGSATQTNDTQFTTAVTSPLDGRYVNPMAVHTINIGTITTPGIYTVKLVPNTSTAAAHHQVTGVELIAQDTTSTANRSKIQIPSQNVVSYGKKFNVSAEGSSGHHYDPFNGFTSGSSVTSYIDTDTSLGVEKWKNSSTYYRPYNGGRVVKWVDSSGVIKTSVTLMPPNAKSIADSSSLTNGTAKANASIANNTFYPTFEAHTTDVNEDNLHEVAKTYLWQEFGNGAANAGTGATYADASMLASNAADDIAYVMDDSLTSLLGTLTFDYGSANEDLFPSATDKYLYVTFIGTGISYYDESDEVWETAVQNLPYGTHIMSFKRDGTIENSPVVIDGVQIKTEWLRFKKFAFHQPKKPPIPEDAVVLADYMLMADFVKQTDAENTQISKGVRYCNGSRDHFYSGAGAATALAIKTSSSPWGLTGGGSPSSTHAGIWKLPFFGTTGLSIMEESNQAHSVKLGGSATTETALDNSVHSQGDLMSIAETVALGQTSIETTLIHGSYHFFGHLVATPIHTSSHYQPFETPFLHELVGGDRNMEQTNLIVSPDGKTWDEVTRDTSYIGNQTLFLSRDGGNINSGNKYIFDYVRGTTGNGRAHFNKDWVLAYDRVICLKDGQYTVDFSVFSNADAERITISVLYNADTNTLFGGKSSASSGEKTQVLNQISKHFKRGDWLKLDVGANTAYGAAADSINSASLQINKV